MPDSHVSETDYLSKPWLTLYPEDWPATVTPEFADMLSMFRAAARRRDAEAVRYFDGVLSFGDLDELSDALAVWLAHNGVRRGDRVVVALQNIPQFPIVLAAVWKLGAIPVPTNPMYTPSELAKIYGDCNPTALVVSDEQLDSVRQAVQLAGIDARLVATSAHEFQTRTDPRILMPRRPALAGLTDFMTALAAHRGERPDTIELGGDEIGLLPYTSGTTGQPKGVMLRHASLAFNAQCNRMVAGLRSDSRILAIAPLFHITGFTCHFGAALSARCSLVLHYRVNPAVVLESIREHRPTYTVGPITAFNALLSDASFRAQDFSSFERATSGGAPMPQVWREKIGALTGLWLENGYGMTESSASTIHTPPRREVPIDAASGALSVGVPTPGIEILIVDEESRPVPIGTEGELWVRGRQVMAGYWRKPEETAAALTGGWLRSGDVALMDAAGWVYIVDRKKDVIIASGFKVWPREVEEALYAHPAVREAAVVGVPDDYRGETVQAYVSLKQGRSATVEELLAHCRGRLAGYKQPRLVEIVAELPKTITGKIQRNLVREQLSRAHSSGSHLR